MHSLQRRFTRTAAALVLTLAGAHTIAANAGTTQRHENARTAIVVAQSATATTTPTDAATDAASPAPVASDTQGGIPWWVWLIVALLVIGLLFFFLNRKKDPTITTRGGPPNDPNIRSR